MEFQNCSACSKVNAALGHKQKSPGIQLKRTLSFEHLQVDFTEMKPCRHCHYLLVMICTFSGWMEALPTQTEKQRKWLAVCFEDNPQIWFPNQHRIRQWLCLCSQPNSTGMQSSKCQMEIAYSIQAPELQNGRKNN